MKVKTTFLILLMTIGMLGSLSATTPALADSGNPTRMPRIVVFSGNGAYHTSVEGFRTNASIWGYEVYSTMFLNDAVLENAEILILNAPDFMTPADNATVKKWWDMGGKALWIIGESDYGGYWNPADLNELIVNLGGSVIIVDDAVSDPVSQDGASYRVVANVTNPAWDSLLVTGWSPKIQNISMHGPTAVAPWNGGTHGNKTTDVGANASWADVSADWLINSSKYAAIQDQDGDDDDVWEGAKPLLNASVTMVAIESGLAGGNKMVYAGESFFADYKDMFGDLARYANNTALQNINLTRSLLEWSHDPMVAAAKTRPTVYVWSGNGAYHTSVEGLIKNASVWGYDIFASTYWVDIILERTDILILNAPDFLTEDDLWNINYWWNTGNRSLWVIGESDYGGYWNPADLNELIVNLGGHAIIIDDAVSDPVSQDGASYRVVANVTNPAWDSLLVTGWSPNIQNISMHGPTGVAPWDGPTHGNKTTSVGANATWADVAADWLINSSKHAAIQDQDGDDDDVWEGAKPLLNASVTMVALEDSLGPWGDSTMVYAGESFFSDYKDMFGYTARYANNTDLQNVNLTKTLLEWSTPTNMRYYTITDDMYAPRIEITSDNTHDVSDADYTFDNEEFNVSFLVHDYPNAYAGLSELYLAYSVDGGNDTMAAITQTGFNSFTSTFGPFDFDTDISYYVYAKDRADFHATSEAASFSVEYSDTLGPEVELEIDVSGTIWTNVTATITATVTDVAEDDEVVSGIDTVVLEYSTDGTTWTEITATVTGNEYVVTMPTSFSDGDTIQVRVVATDKAGNEETSEPISYTVSAPPTTTTSGGPGFELFFGIFALFGIAALMSHRKKR